jgi:hypothetical protein
MGWVGCLAAFAACTNDYDAFDTSGGAGATADASTTDAKGGAAGMGVGGFSGTAGNPAGAGGAPPSGAGGSPQGGAAGSPQGGTAGAAEGGAAGAAQGGAAGAGPCNAGEKTCGNNGCVQIDDPVYGCTDDACDPCALKHATAKCGQGKCLIDSCESGFDDCDANAANGCEAEVAATSGDCGACGRACSSTNVNQASCKDSVCDSTCTAGWGNCTQPAAPAADDGCETALAADPDNCGQCARTCSNSNVAQIACSASKCSSTCQAGFANCVQPAAPAADDGCEVNLQTDAANCGSCGFNCAAVANKVCVAGACACADAAQCTKGGGGVGTCDTITGLCSCGTTVCKVGEWCRKQGNAQICTCFGDVACTGTQVCCASTQKCETTCPP